ncbi:hypothetical protein Q1695_013619 [Nippostrongylus brasiliensis]|nr:hypothetical protein Q1695_013619 [Nippostrongylus brasiliensis]
MVLNCVLCESDIDSIPIDWTDPNDPTYTLRATAKKGELANVGSGEKDNAVYDPTLRLILRQMFKELGIDPQEKTHFSKNARISLSSLDMKVIGSYLEVDTTENEQSMREQVRSALHNMIEVYSEDSSSSLWQELLTVAQPWLSLLNMLILPPSLFFLLKSLLSSSSRSFWSGMLSVFFVVSMVTTYNRLYQEKLAQRMAEAMERKQDVCAPSSLLEQTLEYFTSFMMLRKKSPCLAFVESQTVSVVAEISLMDVFSDVLSSCVFGVLGNLGRHTNRFFREFYENVPLPVMLLMTVTLIFATVRIKTPIFTFEPLLLSTVRHTAATVARCIDGSRNQGDRLSPPRISCDSRKKNKQGILLESSSESRGRAVVRCRHRHITNGSETPPKSRESSLNSLASSSRSQSTPR